jgi:hypothetical protein
MAYTAIDDPAQYFQTVTYSGNGSNDHTITGVGFNADFVWIKPRSGTDDHRLFNQVRGIDKYLETSNTDAEVTDAILTTNSDGYVLTNAGEVNSGTTTYVGWNWKASGSTASNSSGDMTSTVSANTDAGFSIVSWTGDGTAGNTVGHGLNSAPEFILTKALADGTSSWGGYHIGTDATAPEDYGMQIDGSGARIDTANMLNDTAPTSSLVTLGGATYSNHSSNPMIMYAWHSVQGYSKCGSYTGNGNADGTFVYTGFRPAWVIVKSTASGAGWNIHDAKRDTYNEMNKQLYANSNAADGSSRPIDFLSNGFKQRGTTSDVNNSGDTFFYTAFAEAPFVNSNGVPCNAR